MGSVQSEETCRKCGFPYAFSDYNYRTDELFIFCHRCGYCVESYITGESRKGGFGSYTQRNSRGGGVSGCFISKFSAKQVIKKMKKYVRRKDFKGTLYVTKKINGRWFKVDMRTGATFEIPDNMEYDIWMMLFG